MREKYEKLRDKHGLTDYRVSKDTGIPYTTLREWGAGAYQPKIDKIKKLADYFGVSLAYFLE